LRLLATLSLLLSFSTAWASFSFEPSHNTSVKILDSTNGWCDYSGEELIKTYKTNFIARLSDGMDRQYASIRFLNEDFDAIKDRVIAIEVVDSVSGEFIAVENAYFVVNSTLSSPYSKYAKIAFKNESDAKEFIKKYGGDVRDFDFTFYMAGRDVELDKKHFEARDKRAMQRGQRIYERMCEEIEPMEYNSFGEMKKTIQDLSLCGNLTETDLQNVSRYLWDVKMFDEDLLSATKRIEVPEDAKCPVCGMFVAKYPKWVGKISFQDGNAHYFDGAKDLFKYYFDPQKFVGGYSKSDFTTIEVTNYYTLEGIDAKEAYYVIGSRVYGPMGHELIPFTTLEEAQNFKKTHFGTQILRFDEITKQKVYDLDR